MAELHDGLQALGVSAKNNNQSYDYAGCEPNLLERFPNPAKSGQEIEVRIVLPEWVSRCPLTKQPDFANLYIHYLPYEWCVESKSLKLYAGSYKNEPIFMEKTCSQVLEHLTDLLAPTWMCVNAAFAARGGIPLHPTGCVGDVPEAIRRRTYSFGKVEGL